MYTFSDFKAHLATTTYNRLALVLFGVLIAIGYGVGFAVSSQKQKEKMTAADDYNLAVFTDWQMKVTSAMSKAGTTAATIAAFVQSSATSPMNYSASAADRTIVTNDAAFMIMAKDLYDDNPGVFSLEIHSGGVISQMYPMDNSSIFLDLYNFGSTRTQYATMWRTGKPIVAGPSRLAAYDGYGIYVRQPIFTSAPKGKDTFWGTGNVVLRVSGEEGFLRSLNVTTLHDEQGMDFAMWTYNKVDGSLLILDSSPNAHTRSIINGNMQMALPVGEEGMTCFFGMFPTAGKTTDAIEGSVIALVVVVVFFGALAIVAAMYLAVFLYFRYRHRRAPVTAPGTPTYMALLTLRGAQAVVEQSPSEAQRLFAHYFITVRAAAARYGCYAVTAVGDRCLYVVGSDPEAILSMAADCVSGINLITSADADAVREERDAARANGGTERSNPISGANNRRAQTPSRAVSVSRASESQNGRSSRAVSNRQLTAGHNGHAAFINNYENDLTSVNSISLAKANIVSCHCSAIVSAVMNMANCYDAISDVYFYGTARDLSRAGGLLDQLGAGELAWTDGVDGLCTAAGLGTLLTDLAAGPNCASRRIREKGRTAAICVQWWGTGDSEDDEEDEGRDLGKKGGAQHDYDDPSTAMTILGDSTLKKQTARTQALVGRKGESGAGAKGGADGGRDAFSGALGKDKDRDDRTKASNSQAKEASTVRGDNYTAASSNTNMSTPAATDKPTSNAGKGRGADNKTGGHSDSSDDETRVEATVLARSGTVLAVRINGDPRLAFDTIRRVVEENRGVVVCCYENVMLAAYNLLAAGGHHQLRAADTVVRLRARLDCSCCRLWIVAEFHTCYPFPPHLKTTQDRELRRLCEHFFFSGNDSPSFFLPTPVRRKLTPSVPYSPPNNVRRVNFVKALHLPFSLKKARVNQSPSITLHFSLGVRELITI